MKVEIIVEKIVTYAKQEMYAVWLVIDSVKCDLLYLSESAITAKVTK